MLKTDIILQTAENAIESAYSNKGINFTKTWNLLDTTEFMEQLGLGENEWTFHYCYNTRCSHKDILCKVSNLAINYIKNFPDLVKNYNFNSFEMAKLYYLLFHTRKNKRFLVSQQQFKEIFELILHFHDEKTDYSNETKLRYYSTDITIMQQLNGKAMLFNSSIYKLVLIELSHVSYEPILKFLTRGYLNFKVIYTYIMEQALKEILCEESINSINENSPKGQLLKSINPKVIKYFSIKL